MALVIHSQESGTGKGFVWQVFYHGAEVALADLSSRNFVCVLQKLNAICTSAECEWMLYSGWFSISTSLVTTLRGLQMEPELDLVTFIPHACKTLPTFGTTMKGCAWEGEHSCVSGCALPRCFSMNNWAEECKWSLRRQPQAETQPFSPSGLTDVRHDVGTGCCISCIAKASPIYIPFLLSSAACSPPFFICLCVEHLHSPRKNSLKARGTSSVSACATGPYYSGLYEIKAVYSWVAQRRGDISGLNQSNGFDVSVFLRGKGSWDPVIGFSSDADWE